MPMNELLNNVLKSGLLLLAVIALRDIAVRAGAATGLTGWGEIAAETDDRWYIRLLARGCSCIFCQTYWLGLLAAVCLFVLPVAWPGQIPACLLGGLVVVTRKKEKKSWLVV